MVFFTEEINSIVSQLYFNDFYLKRGGGKGKFCSHVLTARSPYQLFIPTTAHHRKQKPCQINNEV